MRIPLHHIPADGLRLDGPLPPELERELAESLHTTGTPVVGAHRLQLTRHDKRVRVRGELDIGGELPCSACLTAAKWHHVVALDVAIVPHDEVPDPLDGGELTEEAVEQYVYEREELDLTVMLHDEIVMELPQRLLCREGCLCLCPACGQNQNELGRPCACEDDRPTGPFAVLQTFRPAKADSKA